MTIAQITNKLSIKDFYFRRFIKINLGVLAAIVVSKFVFQPNEFVVAMYIFILLGFVVFTKLNFELRRPLAGIAGTFLIVFIARLPLLYSVSTRVGIFDTLTDQEASQLYSFMVQPFFIECFTYLGALGVFFLLYDIYHGVKIIQNNRQ